MLCDWRIKKWNLLHNVSTKMNVFNFNSNSVFAQIGGVINYLRLSSPWAHIQYFTDFFPLKLAKTKKLLDFVICIVPDSELRELTPATS